ncbi:MAG: four helix bundle protein [Acidobacteriota bacterium]
MESGQGAELRERAFEFACAVIALHRYIYTEAGWLRQTSGQAMKAAGSIGANLEEADAAQSRADFISKCTISLKEARESRYWLRVLCRVFPPSRDRIEPLIAEATELVAILTTIVRKTRERK